jgi:serine protease Do
MMSGTAFTPAQAQLAPQTNGPASVADLAEGLLESVVNISTSQNVNSSDEPGVTPPQLPEGSPFQDFFDEYFKNRGGDGNRPRKVQSLGSGFVLDAEKGVIITNNHVIADADEIEVNFSDGSKLKAELRRARHQDRSCGAAGRPEAEEAEGGEIRRFRQGAGRRLGDGDRQSVRLGGTVTVGIVSARNRDINSGPYDDFIQTDAAINRGNSGGPLFNMNGEVVGINTAIISPIGGSIGIGFSIPAKLASGVVQQLRDTGTTSRGWLGVRIQEVTDEIAESLGMATAKGALVSGIIKGGPVDNGSVLAGDVIIKFDGRDVERHGRPAARRGREPGRQGCRRRHRARRQGADRQGEARPA